MRTPLHLLPVLILAAANLRCEQEGNASARSAPVSETPALVDGRIHTSTVLPASVDPCLNQSLKDLGVGAKRSGEERQWTLDPRKIHAALVPNGSVHVVAEPAEGKLRLEASAGWEGTLEGPVRAELERRLVALTERIGFFCDQRDLAVSCRSGKHGLLEVCPTSGS